jgi:hypothetical protein
VDLHPFRRPVSQAECLAALTRKNGEDVEPAVQYTLRMLIFQFFRLEDGTATFADEQLNLIYGSPYDDPEDEPKDGQVVEVEVLHADVEAEAQRQAEARKTRFEDNSPADFGASPFGACPVQTTFKNESSIRKPRKLACVE